MQLRQLRGAKRRSNPDSCANQLDCFAALAMTRLRAPAPHISRDEPQLLDNFRFAAARSPFDATCPKVVMQAGATGQCGGLIA
jgi:hypothetical protein